MARLKTLILDLGNVLLFHDNALLFRRLGERSGLSAAEAERRVFSGGWEAANRGALDQEGIRRAVCKALGVELSPEEFFALFNCHFRHHEEMIAAVERRVGQVKLSLLSNTNAVHAAWFLPRLPLLQRFDAVLLSCVERQAKPDRAFFEAALARTGARPEEAAFFDDLQAYVDAAAGLGIHARLFTTVSRFEEDLAALR